MFELFLWTILNLESTEFYLITFIVVCIYYILCFLVKPVCLAFQNIYHRLFIISFTTVNYTYIYLCKLYFALIIHFSFCTLFNYL